MVRSSRLAHAVLLALFFGAQVMLQTCQLFAGTLRPSQSRSHSLLVRNAESAVEAPKLKRFRDMTREEKKEGRNQIKLVKNQIKVWARGVELDGDKLDNLEDFYKETIMGRGGKPEGFMMDLIFRSNFGTWDKKFGFDRSYKFTGDFGQPGPADFEEAWQTFKTNAMEGRHLQGKEDSAGWLWLVCEQNQRGLQLYLTGSPPYGERPLALIKKNNPEEFFGKVDWPRLFARLHKPQLWGGTAQTFPYPVCGDVVSLETTR